MRRRITGLVLAGLLFGAGCGSPPVARARHDVPEPATSPPLAEAPAGSQVTLPAGTAPEGLVADPTTGVLAVGVRHPDGVMLLDLAGRKIRARIVLSGAPRHLRLERPGGPVLVPAEGADRLYLLSLPTGELTGSFPTGRQPHDVASAAGAYFVSDELANAVHLIRPGTFTTIVPGPLQPGGVAASADGSSVMVVGVRGRTVQQMNSSGAIAGSAACGVGPTHIRSGPGELFYVADTEGNRILIFQAGPKGPTGLGSVYTGGTPYGLAIDQRRDLLYVTLTGSNKLRSFRIERNHLEAQQTWPTVRQPNDVTVDDATGAVIIAGAANNVLEFIAP